VLEKKESEFAITQKENLNRMNQEKPEEREVLEPFDKDEEWKTDKFDYFIMKASWKDQFEKGSQVYFCYGRLSNRLMLLRYGCALEWNKYEHIHLKVPYTEELKEFSHTLEKVKYFRLNKWKKFKLRRTSVSVDFLTYCKATLWNMKEYTLDMLVRPVNVDLEILGMEKATRVLEEFLGKFEHSMEENERMLQDPKVFYHDYFAVVYRLERQRLAKFHLEGIRVVIEMLKRVKKGMTPEFAMLRVHDLESDEEYHRNRVFLQNYTLMLLKYCKK